MPEHTTSCEDSTKPPRVASSPSKATETSQSKPVSKNAPGGTDPTPVSQEEVECHLLDVVKLKGWHHDKFLGQEVIDVVTAHEQLAKKHLRPDLIKAVLLQHLACERLKRYDYPNEGPSVFVATQKMFDWKTTEKRRVKRGRKPKHEEDEQTLQVVESGQSQASVADAKGLTRSAVNYAA